MKTMKKILPVAIGLAIGAPAAHAANSDVQTEIDALKDRIGQLESQLAEQDGSADSGDKTSDITFYGSIRTQFETVDSDSDAVDDYNGFRDAYTRIGVKGQHDFNPGYTGFFKYELGIDSTTGEISTLDFDGEGRYGNKQARVSKIGMSTPYGTVSAGKMWGAFYNAIAYPTDQFSSYYTGWATYAIFRTASTLKYSSPTMGGFSFDGAVAFAQDSEDTGVTFGKHDEGGNIYTLTGTYSAGPITASIGYEDRTSDEPTDEHELAGAAITYKQGPLHLAAQYERVMEGDVYGETDADGDIAYLAEDAEVFNVYAGYTVGKNTFKAKVGEAEGVTGELVEVAVDHQYSKNLKFFAEYYEDEGGGFSPVAYDESNEADIFPYQGGSAFAVGAHYSFSM